MAAPFDLPDTCDLYRPYGAAVPYATNVPCRIVPNLARAELAGEPGTLSLRWTHWADYESTVDVRDATTRAAGTNYPAYADGDQVKAVLEGRTVSFVVVFVEFRFTNTPINYKRAYLFRDAV